MSIVRSAVRSPVRSPVRSVLGGVNLLSQATAYLGGVTPYHYADYITNRMLYAGADVGTVAGGTGYSFTRASDGYYENADGTLTLFGSGALRRGDRGVLIEGSRTNLLLRSQEFDNASWTKTNSTVTADSTAAPDGTITADTLTDNATIGFHEVTQSVAFTSGTSYALSGFFKAGTASLVQLTFGLAAFSGAGYANFDLSAGTVAATGGTLVSSGIRALANGWYFCFIVATATATTSAVSSIIRINSSSATRAPSYSGSSTTIFVWQADLQAGAFPSSPIVTVAASATRAADSLSYTAGVTYPIQLFAEFERAVDTGAAETLLAIDNGTNNERVNLGLSAGDLFNLVLVKNAGGVDSVNTTVGSALSTGVTYKGATRAATNAVRPAFGGTLGTEDTAIDMPLAPTTIRIGANASGSQPFGYIRRIAVIQGAGTDAQLQSMTGS
jgi:hypothetical protein